LAEQLVSDLGLLGLFVAALLAASLLPFPVEAVVPVMVAQGYSPIGIVVAGTAGGYVGSLINYRIASRGEEWWRERNPRRTKTLDRMRALFARGGAPLLFFSWLPVVGELLTVVGGLARVRLAVFSFWTVLGRAVRMIALVGLSSLVL
jgi:membrane protein YqaA with SNARE-associated domain